MFTARLMGRVATDSRVVLIKDRFSSTPPTTHMGFSIAILKSTAFMYFAFSNNEEKNVNIFHHAITTYAYWELRLKCTSLHSNLYCR